MEKDLKILFKKFKAGELNLSQELQLFEQVANSHDLESEKLLKETFDNSDNEYSDKDLKDVLSRVHHQIHLNKAKRNTGRTAYLINRISRIAAILFIPLLITSLLYLNQQISEKSKGAYVEIVAPLGSRVNFTLPDGTVGTLNNNASLSYFAEFTKKRNLKLKGEAYFDVAHDKKHPFRIQANKNTIEVVGTRFSVNADTEEGITDLVLEEGVVKFQSLDLDKDILMEAGERILDVNGKIDYSKVDVWKYIAWKDGKLVFRNDSMSELADRLSNRYNVDVEIVDQSLLSYTFRGVFEDDSLEEVLELLKLTSSINYQIEGPKKLKDGSYSRRKVKFYKN